MNLRKEIIEQSLAAVAESYPAGPLHLVEIGCMFRENEGLSTLALATFLAQRKDGGRLISIEYDKKHIEMSRELFRKHAPDLLERVDFRHGHSLVVLPEVLSELKTLHFFSLDGGAHPEVCLQEFELVAAALAGKGMIVVDDVQSMAPSEAYPEPRPFGKATLILPMLALRDYLISREKFRGANRQAGSNAGVPDSGFIRQIRQVDLKDLPSAGYQVIIRAGHQMLLYGERDMVSRIAEQAKPRPVTSAAKTGLLSRLASFIRRAVK